MLFLINFLSATSPRECDSWHTSQNLPAFGLGYRCPTGTGKERLTTSDIWREGVGQHFCQMAGQGLKQNVPLEGNRWRLCHTCVCVYITHKYYTESEFNTDLCQLSSFTNMPHNVKNKTKNTVHMHTYTQALTTSCSHTHTHTYTQNTNTPTRTEERKLARQVIQNIITDTCCQFSTASPSQRIKLMHPFMPLYHNQ